MGIEESIQQIVEMATAEALADYQDNFWSKTAEPELKHIGLPEDIIEVLRVVCESAYHCGAALGASSAVIIMTKRAIDMTRKGEK